MQRVGGRVDTHINEVAAGAGVATTRWFYRQRIQGTLTRTHRPWALLLDAGGAAPYSLAPARAEIETVPVTLPAVRTRVIGLRAPHAGEQTIRPEAKLLFVAGAGWTKKQRDGQAHAAEAEKLILGFVRNCDASLGGSKSLVDLSGEGQPVLQFMTHLHQVGQTGSTPRHPKGLATCCHGEEPHVVGWRFITRAPGHQPRRQLRLGPRQGRCALCRGRLRGHGPGARSAAAENARRHSQRRLVPMGARRTP